ncbi:hypothetical protein [Weissella confusa]|uniref:hypothetical protein n=1 Tax=Weissella confusa TaxID=1583 RepID=UPI0022FE654D|nr:hypothetical protein [Weissella confusa]MDA5457826.1 putative membrane protein [Weissella confusa]
MDFYMRLPRNGKEFALFLAIVSIISVNIIAPLITFFEAGFRLQVWFDVLRVLPFIWVAVVILVLLTNRPAQALKNLIVKPDDSFNAQIIVNTLMNVLLMSVVLTVVGTWIGTLRISMDPITHFFYKWPRNFAISFAVEALIAQPIARTVLYHKHKREDAKQAN